jgi:uncharacterized Rossmann fold enzyme
LNLKDWDAWYNRIVNIFGYSRREDQRAADVLSRLLGETAVPLDGLRTLVHNQPVLILGAGPSLEDDLKGLMAVGVLGAFVLVAADGATTAVLHVSKAVPRIVVTDLDGKIVDLLHADRLGALLVVHGHGDNIPQLERIVPQLVHVIGTTQVRARPNVYNFGGFTDGDRAVFLAVEMGAKLIVLAGMDFGQEVGKFSKTKLTSIDVKRRKLEVGKALLKWLATRTTIPLYDVTRRGEGVRGYQKITPDQVLTVL